MLTLLLFALGVGLISLMFLLKHQISDNLNNNLNGVNLVVGAKGSPLQTILSSVYHIDVPTGNIPLRQGESIGRIKKLIEKAIPQALGDAYNNFRIVGTTHDYPDLYHAQLAQGQWWKDDMEATVGAFATQKCGLKIGDTFFGSHGITGESMHKHEDHAYKVVGILQPTGTVMDKLILTNVGSVWMVHEKHEEHEEHEEEEHEGHNHEDDHDHEGHDHENSHQHEGIAGHDHEAEGKNAYLALHNHPEDTLAYEGKEMTSYILVYQKEAGGNPSPMADVMLPKIIDENFKAVGYAFPLREMYRLLDLTGFGISAIQYLALLFIFVSGLSVFISLYNSLKERKYELSLIRVMGGTRMTLFSLILLEGFILAFLGFILGIFLSHAGMTFLASMLEESYQYSFKGFGYFVIEEAWLFVGALVVGLIASLIPAWQAYSTDISKTLAEN